jgi:exopolysaccharide biosynthesis polyprenyl glycosylphosphotransferase
VLLFAPNRRHPEHELAAPVRSLELRARPRPARRAARRDLFEGAPWLLLSGVADAVMLWLAVSAAMAVTVTPVAGGAQRALLLAVVAGIVVRLASAGMYGGRPGRMAFLDTTKQCLVSAGQVTLVVLAVTALTHQPDGFADLLALTGAFGAAAVAAARLGLGVARRRARVHGVSGKRAVIVGAGYIGAQLERRLLERPSLGLRPVGFVDGDPAPAFLHGDAGHGPVLGAPDDLEAIVTETGAQHVIIAFSSAPDSTIGPLVRRCEQLGLEVSVVPRLFENVNDRQWVEHVGGMPLCGLRTENPRSWKYSVKHGLDRLVAGGALIVAAPLFAGVALAVRLSSPGPIFFRQRRVGRDGQNFDILKFRSMRVAPHTPDAELAGRLVAAGAAPGGVEGFDRRTRVGTFIRRTSLDEIPQLLNIVRGHMSLVGPRPERPEFVELFGPNVQRYGDRHRVKSGLTGWAQVHGLRGQTSLAERVEWDNWYIQNWSLWLDLKIVLMTPLEVLRSSAEGNADGAPAAAVASPTEPLSAVEVESAAA